MSGDFETLKLINQKLNI